MKHPKVDIYFERLKAWQPELTELRNMLLETELTEDFKWYHPCYTINEGNVIILGHFKDYCTISFFKGSFIKDKHNLLVKPGPNTQSDRIVKITSLDQVKENRAYLIDYINQAIKVEKQGLKYDYKKEYPVPAELTKVFKADLEYKKAFNNLTPGKQHGYLLHFNSAKQSSTRVDRINKYRDQIIQGIPFQTKKPK